MRTPNLPLSSLVLLSSAIGLLLSVAAFAADPVYKWKDSSGQSHYSQSPPPGVKYETITPIGVTTTTEAPASAASAPAPAASAKMPAPTHVSPGLALHQKNCATARNNLALLTSHPTANIDSKGTGRPSRVTPEQRAAELERANQLVAQYCGK
jgi:hypothetical protein